MTNTIIPPEKLPGLPKLVLDYWTAFDKVASFYSHDFRNWENYARLAEQARRVARSHMAEIVSILSEQNRSFGCSGRTLENLQRLSHSDALAIVTGQQVGLFGGPLYTIYKALTIIKLTQELSHRLNAPVLPVFYLVSEDHDFAEVQWAGLIDRSNQFMRLQYLPEREQERRPVSQIMLEPSISQVIEQLAANTADSDFKQEVLKQLGECYQTGASFSTGFARWFTRLFAEYGIILLDASDPRLKRFAVPVFTRELQENLSNQAMAETNQRLAALGYHAQLAMQPKRPNVFLLDQGRHSLEWENGGYRNLHSGQRCSIDELIRRPELLSPKAALRPLVQDTLLPTIAYVGGPGEIAYWAQLKRVYEAFRLPMPIVVPRAGITLIEPKVRRHLERFSLSPAEVIVNPETTLGRAKLNLIPEDFRDRVAASRSNIEKEWKALGDQVARIDPTLQGSIEKVSHQISHQFDILESKIIKSFSQRESIVTEQLKAISESLLPEGKLQERQLNVVPFLIKYNWPILTKIFDAIDVNRLDHQLLEL